MLVLFGTAKAYFDYLKDVQAGRRQAPEDFERAPEQEPTGSRMSSCPTTRCADQLCGDIDRVLLL